VGAIESRKSLVRSLLRLGHWLCESKESCMFLALGTREIRKLWLREGHCVVTLPKGQNMFLQGDTGSLLSVPLTAPETLPATVL
jgi:hypothetical protein